MEQSPRFLAVMRASDLSIAVARRRIKRIRGLIGSAKKLLGSDLAENIYLSAISAYVMSKTKVLDVGNIQTTYELERGKLKYLFLMALLPVIVILKFIFAVLFHPAILKSKCKYGVRIFNGDYGFTYGTGRDIDFIVGDGTSASDVLFCPETDIPNTYMSELHRRGYNVLPLKYCFMYGDVLGALRAWPGFMYHSLGAGTEETRISIDILLKYILWTGFLNRTSLNVYMVYGDYVSTAMVRTALFNHAGVKIWYYCNSYAYWYLYAGGENKKEWILAFYACDKALTWGNAQKRYLEKQSKHIKLVESVGCLWNYCIRRTPHEGKVISVFDSSYGVGPAPNTYLDALQFLKDVIRLADERDVTILFKMKAPHVKTESYGPISSLYEQIERHPRIKIVTDGVRAISTSDLVISGPYSSPTLEALSAGVKGIYHDACGNVRSNLCEGIPNLVSHNYDELVTLVDYWLEDMNDIIFNVFLQTYILGEIDVALDQRGVERLRNMIKEV